MGRTEGPNAVVRRGDAGDYERLEVVFDEAERYHRRSLPAVFRQPRGRFPSAELYGAMAGGALSAVFVADDGEDLVGFVSVRVEHAPDEAILRPRTFAVVDLLAVRSDRRHQGIGRRLMEAAQAWANELELPRMSLNVWEFNGGAIAFYGALGYETVSRQMERPL